MRVDAEHHTSHEAHPNRVRVLTSKVEEHLPELRGNLTPQERVLWDALRGRKLDDVKFRRQHPIGAFVLDFYAPEIRLVIELDGDVHDVPVRKARDRSRDAHLIANGYHVVRVTNMEVILDLPAVLERLSTVIAALRGGLPSPPAPLPIMGEGSTGSSLREHGGGE